MVGEHMHNITSTPHWFYCLGCGAWQASKNSCQICNSLRLVSAADVGNVDESTGTKLDSSAVRVLVDVEVRSNGEVRATRLCTARLTPILHDGALLSALDGEVRTRLGAHVSEEAAWAALHVAARDHVRDAVSRALPSRWTSRAGASQLPVELGFRLLNLKADGRATAASYEWLEVVPFNDALKRATARLKPGDVKAELYGSVLSLADGGDRLQLGLRVSVEAAVSQVVLCPTDKPSEVLAKFESSTFLARDQMTRVLDTRISAPALWRLAPQSKGSPLEAELRVHLQGLEEKPDCTKVPCGDLGLRSTLVDVFLDLGSTTTKYIVRVGDSLTPPQTKRTARLAEEWSLPRYEKAKLLADKSGAEWCKWITALLPALRRYAAREHKGYLRSVYLTLPQSGDLDVAELSKAIVASNTASSRGGRSLNDSAVRALIERAGVDAVGFAVGGQVVVLMPEHEAVARHYLEPLQVLHEAAGQYHRSFKTKEEERTHQQRRQTEWDKKRAEQKEYDDSFFLWRWINDRPEGPSGKRPKVDDSLTSPAAWMSRLAAHPELLSRVVILDVGGLSLDIAVLDSNKLVSASSKSDTACGGEKISRKLAEQLKRTFSDADSEKWTLEKARLGNIWSTAADPSSMPMDERFRRFGGPTQRAYYEVTRELSQKALNELVSSLSAHWGGAGSRCSVFMTGGGSRNPHFRDLVDEQFAAKGLVADVVDARALQDLIDEARSFPLPLPELSSKSVELFTTVHGWAHQGIKGANTMAYDKYAVVGGLLTGAQK